MNTLFEDTALFSSGALRQQSFDLPDADLHLWEHFFNRQEADEIYTALLKHTPWEQRPITVFDKTVPTPRLTAWYGKQRDTSLPAIPFTPLLLQIKERVERSTQHRFTSVLLNLYRDGNDGVAWHRDQDRELGPRPVVGSVSFGETRPFEIRHKFRKELPRHSIPLHHGSLLLMAGTMQHFWEHRIPKTSKQIKPRINLTFRTVLQINQ
ncbi:MAG TPA: alpha-ketoglutarate-dependent dioxygenase AlkB [Chitinophagaceae bacterium]|nr:alpha-ketoglutarate-dependent dioxygenase AlkB [Chitinophagaceae bacterium]